MRSPVRISALSDAAKKLVIDPFGFRFDKYHIRVKALKLNLWESITQNGLVSQTAIESRGFYLHSRWRFLFWFYRALQHQHHLTITAVKLIKKETFFIRRTTTFVDVQWLGNDNDKLLPASEYIMAVKCFYTAINHLREEGGGWFCKVWDITPESAVCMPSAKAPTINSGLF